MQRTLTLGLAVILAASAVGCAQRTTPQHYGEPMALDDAATVTVVELMSNRDAYEGKRVRVKGKVHDLCEHRGCWLELAEGDEIIFVSGFAVCEDTERGLPLEARDREAVVEGVLKVVMVPEEEARHIAKEHKGATDEEVARIVGPQPTLQIVEPGADIWIPVKAKKECADGECSGECGACDDKQPEA